MRSHGDQLMNMVSRRWEAVSEAKSLEAHAWVAWISFRTLESKAKVVFMSCKSS